MCPTALIPILCAKKKRPQPGEDGYGRLVRVQLGRGGMMIRVPSNRSLTPIARKGFRAPSWAADRLAKWNLSDQIPLMGDTSRGRDLKLSPRLTSSALLPAPSPPADRQI